MTATNPIKIPCPIPFPIPPQIESHHEAKKLEEGDEKAGALAVLGSP